MNILKQTDFLENLDIEFNEDEIREQMLFTFALAEYTCLVPLAYFDDIYRERLRKK
ncbi:hypothetical protein MC7420_4420 [Coleofasciculus chthonoplastes PCC 7420]|uniref:Uncharacterized protein n=1 Tax=Coleofasciculus chthonoplastes PCC 7420 TaxID=118168 RepID=B4VY54_9CYAN|nr:hypothetical protein MC7420_4420 [Coleofasciculus chthonoplastes PCC 7420]